MRSLKTLIFVALVFFAGMSNAWASLLITPTILVFEPEERFASVTLVNNGDQVNTYAMKWIYFKVSEDTGGYELTEQVNGVDIREYLVLSPRRVTLKPGEQQKVRIALRRPADLPDGDYRAHLRFEVDGVGGDLPSVMGGEREGVQSDSSSAQVAIKVNYSIPVIVRSGRAENLDVAIGQISLERDPANGRLSLTVPLSKNLLGRSLLSYMKVYNVISGKRELVGELSNAYIYEGVYRRSYKVPLRKEIAVGSLEVVLENYERDDRFVIAKRVFPLQ